MLFLIILRYGETSQMLPMSPQTLLGTPDKAFLSCVRPSDEKAGVSRTRE